jgi:hypothetical protein
MPNEVETATAWRCIVHAYVECRVRGGTWWLYAHPALPRDEYLPPLLVGASVEEGDEPLSALGVPSDVSLAVRDEYTWRVAGPRGGDAPSIVNVSVAEDWIKRGRAQLWTTAEAFARVTDPRWSHATWLDTSDLGTVINRYERRMGESAPAGYCALLSMMRALERDYIVRLVIWLERQFTVGEAAEDEMSDVEIPLREYVEELENARAIARVRRPRKEAARRE